MNCWPERTRFLKKIYYSAKFLALCLALLLVGGCAPQKAPSAEYTDDLGTPFSLSPQSRVVCCYGSFAECWSLAGGSLVGATQDALDERGLDLNGAQIVGTVKEINLERVVALQPDLVILSADLAAHLSLKESLAALKIPTACFRVDTFEDYRRLMKLFCTVLNNPAAFKEHVTQVGARIDEILQKIPRDHGQTALLMRAYSTGIKAKGQDHLAGQILQDFGVLNITDQHPSLLEELSPEEVIRQDPQVILVSAMGNEASAHAYLKEHLETNPAWQKLQAVETGRYVLLPKDLFHYKPNHRWDESYEFIAKILFPEVFA